MERAFSPFFACLTTLTQPVGLGWDSGAPLALCEPVSLELAMGLALPK